MKRKNVLRELLKQDRDSDNLALQREISKITDNELWLEFQSGNETAFELIYRENVTHLCHYGLKIVNKKEFVWDILQDLFVELWNKRGRLGQVTYIKPYLYKALRNKLIREASREKKLLRLEEQSPEVLHDQEDVSGTPDFEVTENIEELKRKLRLTLSRLSRKQQEVIHLRFYSGLSVKEITKITGINEQTVYYNLSRGLELLKEISGHLIQLFICFSWCRKRQLLP